MLRRFLDCGCIIAFPCDLAMPTAVFLHLLKVMCSIAFLPSFAINMDAPAERYVSRWAVSIESHL